MTSPIDMTVKNRADVFEFMHRMLDKAFYDIEAHAIAFEDEGLIDWNKKADSTPYDEIMNDLLDLVEKSKRIWLKEAQ